MRFIVYDSYADQGKRAAIFDAHPNDEFHNATFETFEEARNYLIKCLGPIIMKINHIDISDIILDEEVYYGSVLGSYMVIHKTQD